MTKEIEQENIPFRGVLERLAPNPGAEMLRYGWRRPDILSLGQGEGDLKTPDFITSATHKAMKEGKTFYGPVVGRPELRQEIAAYYTRLMGLNMPTGRIFVTPSGSSAMHLALTSILEEDDEVVAITPIWKNLLGAVGLAQAKVVQVPLDENENGWNLDLEKVFQACTSRTKAILIVTPSNPTGWIMRREEMKDVLEFARARGIWIISDEVYNRSVFYTSHAPSFLEIAQDHDFLFTINSFSKSYAMTGWRLGWLVGPPESENIIQGIALYNNMGPPTFTQFGGIEALRHGEDFIAQQLESWRSNLDLLTDRFRENPRIHTHRPPATFYSFFRIEGEEDCMALAKRLIDEGGLSLAPGCAFGECCKSWLRLCFAVSERKLVEAIDKLEQVING